MESPDPVALVTGASRGIGRAIALELAGSGMDVAVNYASNRAAAEETVRGVEERGRRALAAQADVARAADRSRLLQTVREAHGRIDVLVNNAGIAPRERRDLLEATEESFDEVLGVNLRGPFFLTRDVARWMLEIRERDAARALHVVNISSLSEYTASPHRGDYCMAKAGLGMMTELFAARLAPHGILVNSVRPGIIETDMTAAARETYDRRIRESLTPLRRWGRPEDVARAVRALVRGDFEFSTGAAIDVDGGFRLKTL